MRAIAETHLRPTLFHELHHMARGPLGLDSLIDFVITEGLATAFERDFAGAAYPWSEYPDDASDWAAELLALPSSARREDWMFRHPDGRRWIGYRQALTLWIGPCSQRGCPQTSSFRHPRKISSHWRMLKLDRLSA